MIVLYVEEEGLAPGTDPKTAHLSHLRYSPAPAYHASRVVLFNGRVLKDRQTPGPVVTVTWPTLAVNGTRPPDEHDKKVIAQLRGIRQED